MNKFDEMRAAVQEAEATLRAVDSVATNMADLLVGRLKKVKSVWALRQLKRELRGFDMTTGTWKK